MRMKDSAPIAALSLILCLLLAACGTETPTNTPVVAPTGTTAPPADTATPAAAAPTNTAMAPPTATAPAAAPPATTAAGAPPGAGQAGTPQQGGTLVIATSTDPGQLNGAITTSGNTHPISDQIFNGLVGLDDQLNPVPELAASWDIADGGKTYTFHLQQGVLWHDGQPFTSADVKFTFEQALLKFHSRTKAGLENVLTGIDTPDDLTVVFRFKQPYGPLLQRLDVVEAPIIPKHIYEGKDLQKIRPTSSRSAPDPSNSSSTSRATT